MRRKRRWGAERIAREVGLSSSTVQQILNRAGVDRLDHGDRATKEPVHCYQRDRPGELIHVDIKTLAGIPAGGGWKINGRGSTPGPNTKAGYRFLHTEIDERTRIAY